MSDAPSEPVAKMTPGRELATVSAAFLTYGLVFFDRLAPLYLVALIAADLGAPSAAEGTLALLVGLGWAAAMPVVRATTGRFDDRTRIAVAVVVSTIFSLLSAAAGSWLMFIVLRGLGGIGAGSGSPVFTSLMFTLAPPERRGMELGIVQASTRIIGSLAGPIVVTAVTVAYGWRQAMVVSALLLLASVVVFLFVVPGGGQRPGSQGPKQPFVWRAGGRRHMILCTVGCIMLLAWLNVWSQSSVAMIGDWLQLTPDEAGRYVGLFGIGSGIAAVLLPAWSDRIGRRMALGLGALLGGAGGFAVGFFGMIEVIPPGWVVTLVIMLGGVAMGVLPLTISIIPAEAVASGDRARALLIPIAAGEILGAALLPGLAALMAASFGSPVVVAAAGLGVFGLVVVAILLQPLGPPEVHGTLGTTRKEQ